MNERAKILLLVLVLLVGVLTVRERDRIQEGIRKVTSRGIKNNNPGNIRRTGIGWRGEVADELKTDDEFEQFTDPVWGIRAMARELRTGAKRGEDTIREIISLWAPPVENDTEAYIASVSRQTGIPADQPINFELSMAGIIRAIIRHENGANPYPDELIREAIALA